MVYVHSSGSVLLHEIHAQSKTVGEMQGQSLSRKKTSGSEGLEKSGGSTESSL